MNLQDDPDFADDFLLDWYLWFFAARRDAYVANSSEVIHEPLTTGVVREALAHRYPISGFMAQEDGQTHVGAIDFDTPDGLEQALKIESNALLQGLWPMVEVSRRGAHLWVCAWGRVTQGQMHKALKALLPPTLESDTHVEVFPKMGVGNFGSGALRIPGLHHHLTQEQYPILREGKPVEGGIKAAIAAYQWTSPEVLIRVGETSIHRRRTRYPQRLTSFYSVGRSYSGDEPKASEVLAGLGIEVRPGGTVRCPMHEDRRRSLTIFRDDTRVFCGSPSCTLNGAGHGVGSIQLARILKETKWTPPSSVPGSGTATD